MASLTVDISNPPVVNTADEKKTTQEVLTSNILASSAIKQAHSAQDFAAAGMTQSGKYQFTVVADGHGSSKVCETIAYLRSIDWGTLLDDDEFLNIIIADIDKLDTRGEGSTLSIVRIVNHRIICGGHGDYGVEPGHAQCYWIGDSSIKIYEDGKLLFKSKDHDRNNKEEIKRISETCNMRGIQCADVWDVEVVNATTIKSVPGAIFDFGGADKINMTNALGHSGKTGKYFQSERVMMDPNKSYKAIAASDGFWQVCYAGDEDLIGSPGADANMLVDFANKRWRQEWVHDNTHQMVSGLKFPESNIDDICMGVILVKPFVH